MPNSPSHIDVWGYSTVIISTLALCGLLVYIIFKVREHYMDEESEGCDWQTTLTEYRELEQKGLITKEEFQRIKQQIISGEPTLKDSTLKTSTLKTSTTEETTSSDDSANPVGDSQQDVREESKDAS